MRQAEVEGDRGGGGEEQEVPDGDWLQAEAAAVGWLAAAAVDLEDEAEDENNDVVERSSQDSEVVVVEQTDSEEVENPEEVEAGQEEQEEQVEEEGQVLRLAAARAGEVGEGNMPVLSDSENKDSEEEKENSD